MDENITREDIIEQVKTREAIDYKYDTKVVTLKHHEHIVNKLFDYIEHIETEWFTVKELLNYEIEDK